MCVMVNVLPHQGVLAHLQLSILFALPIAIVVPNPEGQEPFYHWGRSSRLGQVWCLLLRNRRASSQSLRPCFDWKELGKTVLSWVSKTEEFNGWTNNPTFNESQLAKPKNKPTQQSYKPNYQTTTNKRGRTSLVAKGGRGTHLLRRKNPNLRQNLLLVLQCQPVSKFRLEKR